MTFSLFIHLVLPVHSIEVERLSLLMYILYYKLWYCYDYIIGIFYVIQMSSSLLCSIMLQNTNVTLYPFYQHSLHIPHVAICPANELACYNQRNRAQLFSSQLYLDINNVIYVDLRNLSSEYRYAMKRY